MFDNAIGFKGFGIVLSAFLAGTIASITLVTIPVAISTRTSTPYLVQIWSQVYANGHRKGPAMAVVGGLLYAGAAWERWSRGQAWTMLLAAGMTTVAMIPYTWVFMLPTNGRLFAALEGKSVRGATGNGEVVQTVKTWGALNGVRALFPLMGAVLGCLA